MAQAVVIENVLHAGRCGAIFSARTEDGQLRRFVANEMPRAPIIGESWEVGGVTRRHPKYGPQVHVESVKLLRPSGRLLVHLLAGPRFPGIGPMTAQALWNHHGERLYDLLDQGDGAAILDALGEGGRSRAQAEVLISVWPQIAAEPAVLAWLDRYGFTQGLAHKVIACFGPHAIAMLEQNPYRMLAFANWQVVDLAAKAMGIGPNDERRLIAACEAALYKRLDSSHTLTSTPTLRNLVSRLLGPSGAVQTAIELATEDQAMISDGQDGWRPLGPAAMEAHLVDRLIALLTGQDQKGSHPQLFHGDASQSLRDGAIERWELAQGMELNVRQKEAIALALTSPVALLLGGAGVGKTTVLQAICDLAAELGVATHLMALSGRAALRMTEATGRQARTITGFLMQIEAGGIALADEPLIIIDEASMVDLTSLYRIFRLAPAGCRFLLVGDPGQLPPVSFGVTLHALAESGLIPQVELTDIMRQAKETGIPTVAAAIRAGEIPTLSPFNSTDQVGVSFVECTRAEVVSTVQALCADLAASRPQVLGSVKGSGDASDGGIRAINNAMHAAFIHGREALSGGYGVGEPVIFTVNDYELRIMNGSLGTVIGIDTDEEEALLVDFDGDRRRIPYDRLDDLELAWAITTHKAQGSQFEVVIVVVTSNRILDRTLLYTAITRAKRRVVLVGDLAAFGAAITEPPASSLRQTGLSFELRRLAEVLA